MLEHAYYSVISPEGCAGILWKSHTFKEQAAQALKMTSKDLTRLGVGDDVLREPLGGAHRDHHLTASRLKIYLRNALRELVGIPVDRLLEMRYQKFRRMGVFLEGGQSNEESVPDIASAKLPATVVAGEQPSAARGLKTTNPPTRKNRSLQCSTIPCHGSTPNCSPSGRLASVRPSV